MKPIRVRAPDWQRLLLSKDVPSFVADLRRRVRDDDAAVELLEDLIVDIDRWRASDVPGKAARALVALGHTDALVDLFLDLIDDWDLDDLASEIGVGALCIVIGEHADPPVVDRILDLLDEVLVEDGAPHPAWLSLVEILASFGERGVRSERAWSWLTRVRIEDELLWCAYVSGYGDERAVPILRAIVDRFDRAELLARPDYDEDQQLVIEAAGALDELGAEQPGDNDLVEGIRAAIQSRQAR